MTTPEAPPLSREEAERELKACACDDCARSRRAYSTVVALYAERDAALDEVASVQADCINAMCPWCRAGHEALAPDVKGGLSLGWHHVISRILGAARIENCKAAGIWASLVKTLEGGQDA